MENVLALRGDINPDLPRRMDFLHASDLAKAIAQTGGFGVAGACYPEGHVESPSLKADVESPVSYTHLDVYKRQALW